MRYAVSGVNDTALGDLTTGIELMGRELTSGRVLWLRSMWAFSASGAAPLTLFDGTEGLACTASSRRFTLQCASGVTTMAEFPAPGLKFTTNVCVVGLTTADGTISSGTGGYDQGQVGGAGYEEG